MTTPQPPTRPDRMPGALARSLITLAGMPDDASSVDEQLVLIAKLAADRIAAVDYASVTAVRENAYTTVAASSELAEATGCRRVRSGCGDCATHRAPQATRPRPGGEGRTSGRA